MKASSNTRPAIFLDRDGVIIHDVHYLARADQALLIEGVGDAIARVNAAGYLVVVVTNQAGVARGYFPERAIHAVHERIDNLLSASRAHVDRYYYCPHHPDAAIGRYRRHCLCRKPAAGMLWRAAEELNIDLSRSFLVGDKVSDVEAAQAAGCAPILVETGYGRQSTAKLLALGWRDLVVWPTLQEAAEHCLQPRAEATPPSERGKNNGSIANRPDIDRRLDSGHSPQVGPVLPAADRSAIQR